MDFGAHLLLCIGQTNVAVRGEGRIDRDGTVPDREFKLMCAFYEPAYSNLVEWTRIFMTHKNRFTGRSLAEEPALCGIGLINEGNLGRDGVDGLKKCPGFAEAWAAAGGAGEAPRPLPTDVYGKKPANGELAIFLAEREKRLFACLRSLLRDELGCQAPLSNLNAGIWRFAWSHTKQGVETPGSMPIRFFDLHSDPVRRASEYATLALYLRGDMESLPAESESAEVWNEEELRDPKRGAVQFGSPRKGISAWERRVGARLSAGANAPHFAGRDGPALQDGSAPTNDSSLVTCHSSFGNGRFRVVTPRTCGGFAEASALECGPLRFEIAGHDGPAPQENCFSAAVWATSLDGASLAKARRILVAHVTDAANTGAVFDGPEARSWLEQGTTPPLVRRGRARIELMVESEDGGREAPAVFRLSPTGHRVGKVSGEVSRSPSANTLSFTADTAYDSNCATLFYEIVR